LLVISRGAWRQLQYYEDLINSFNKLLTSFYWSYSAVCKVHFLP